MSRHVLALVYLWRSAGSFSQAIRLSSKYHFTCGAIVSPARWDDSASYYFNSKIFETWKEMKAFGISQLIKVKHWGNLSPGKSFYKSCNLFQCMFFVLGHSWYPFSLRSIKKSTYLHIWKFKVYPSLGAHVEQKMWRSQFSFYHMGSGVELDLSGLAASTLLT